MKSSNDSFEVVQIGNFGTTQTVKAKDDVRKPEGDSPGQIATDVPGAGSVTGGADPWSCAHNGISEFERVSRCVGVTLRIYAGELKVIFPRSKRAPKRKPPKRRKGDITTFSRKSRLRLLKVYNRIHQVCLGDPIFITLTARPECFENRAEFLAVDQVSEAHNYIFRKEFLPMLKQIVPELCYVWKMEPHKTGQAHYHLMVWSKKKARKLESEFYKRKIRQLWRTLIDDHSRSAELYSCKIKGIDNERQCFNYISEYIMKEETHETAKLRGRRWGRSKSLPVHPILEVGVRMEAYEVIRDFCVELLKRRKSNTDDYIDTIMEGCGWSMWLDPGTIVDLLRSASRNGMANKYERYMKTGSVDPPDEELAQIASDYGVDY